MSDPFIVRRATVTDVLAIARHRAQMFTDMGTLPPALCETLVTESTRYLEAAIPLEEYVAWLAAPHDAPQQVVAGAGVQRRRVLPHPLRGHDGVVVARGEQGIVVNVFTERAWRRRGLARLLMEHVMRWANGAGLDTLVLHASGNGRPLYDRLGFEPTHEMRYAGRFTGAAYSVGAAPPD